MTKNRFLSKRLACLLTTTALLTTSLSNSAYADPLAVIIDDTDILTVDNAGGAGATQAYDSASFTTLAGVAAGITYTFGDNATDIFNIAGALTLNNAMSTDAVASENILVTAVGTLNVTGATTLTSIATADTNTNSAATLTLSNTATFTGSVTLGETLTSQSKIIVNDATTKTITFTGGLLSNTAGDGELQISNGSTEVKTIAGSIGTSAKRFGLINIDTPTTLSANTIATSVTIDGNTTVSGTLDATGINIAANKTATFTNNLTAGANHAVVIGTAAFSGTSAQSVTGSLRGDGTTGNITVLGTADVTFNTEVGASNTTEIQTLTTSNTARATMTLDGNNVNEVILGTGTTLEVAKTVLTTQALFTTSAAQDLDSIHASSIILMPVNLKDGQFIDLFDGGTVSAALNTDVNSALRDNALIDYTAATADTNHTRVTATAKSAATTSSELGISNNMAIALKEAYLSSIDDTNIDGAAEDAMYNALQAQGGFSTTEDTALAKQVSPQTDTITGSTIAAKAVTSGVQNVISTRLASLRSGDAYSTGVVTGSGMSANSGFIQAFGSTVEQKNKGNEFGYDADTTGFAVGFDGKIDGGAVIGISYARSEADVDGKGTGRAKNDITTDSVSLYADYATKDGYVEGSITYGKSDNKGLRIVNTAGLNRTYNSNYDGEQYSFRLSGGIPQSLGGGAFFTPFAAATISQIKTDAYTEKSTTANDALRLRVAQDTVESQVGTVGVKFHQAIKDGKTTFTPEVKLAVNQEFGDDTITSTNTYQGGGASFKNSTAIEKTSATAGVGLNISADNVSFNIGYEADVREDYLGHSAQAKITAKF
jgi:uncharacterized protein with beta-barrel porin domain